MRIAIHGGVGEKGRTCIGVEHESTRLLLDVGVDTSSARGPAYYPAIAPDILAATDAIIVTHAHEDHVGALGWCLANGFSGRILMTAEAAAETAATLAAYATPEEYALAAKAPVEIIEPGQDFRIGPLSVRTGRSGHVVGGVWCHLSAGGRSLGYCGDVVPASPVFAMDPMPACDLFLVDASYGEDRIPAAERGRAVTRWLQAHPQGAVLPTPLTGRSVELIALIESPIAIHPSMREPLAQQIAAARWLASPGLAEKLASRLATAGLWHEGEALPAAALLCHDGMGLSGPSRTALEQAGAAGHPVLLTGHLPKGSPGEIMLAAGKAEWLRFPTHPTLPENAALAAASGASLVLAHSCDLATARALVPAIARLNPEIRPGDVIDV
jgi:glyoxylase-like metal-dependent hydrolase (beta-lactamase superfamily II)